MPASTDPRYPSEGLLSPGHSHGVDDRGEGRDGGEHAGVIEVSHEVLVTSHTVPGDALALGVHREQALLTRERIRIIMREHRIGSVLTLISSGISLVK